MGEGLIMASQATWGLPETSGGRELSLWHVQLCGDRHRVGGEVASEVRQLGKSGRSVLQTEETATTKPPSLGAA